MLSAILTCLIMLVVIFIFAKIIGGLLRVTLWVFVIYVVFRLVMWVIHNWL